MWELLISSGFDPHRLIAALAGGVCASIAHQKPAPGEIVRSIVVGGLFGSFSQGGDPFLTGVIAMSVCQGITTYVKRKTK